jgi:methionyl-tRNA formyltransferase
LADNTFNVRFVVSQPDKPVGRHQELVETSVKAVARHKGIPVFQPEKIKNNTEFFDEIRGFDVDYFVVVAYGRIMPKELLEIPKIICINVHGSILPRYRGASPIQASLMAGDMVTGVTIMKMSE